MLRDHRRFIAAVESHCLAQLSSNYGEHAERRLGAGGRRGVPLAAKERARR